MISELILFMFYCNELIFSTKEEMIQIEDIYDLYWVSQVMATNKLSSGFKHMIQIFQSRSLDILL